MQTPAHYRRVDVKNNASIPNELITLQHSFINSIYDYQFHVLLPHIKGYSSIRRHARSEVTNAGCIFYNENTLPLQ